MSKNQNFKMLTDQEHVLAKIPMYAGADKRISTSQFIFKDDKITKMEINVVPAILKLASELFDNSVDEYIRTNGRYANKIDITITDNIVRVQDNGRGIPVKQVETYKGLDWQPKLSWTELKAGTNFSSDSETTIGTFGVGSSLCSVLSTEFIGISDDGENKCTVKCLDNNSNIDVKISKSTKCGCDVTMKIDMKRFDNGNLEIIDEAHISMIRQRLLNLSLTYPGISFTLNKEKIKINDKLFLSYFGEGVSDVTDNITLGIFNSETDDFQQFSLVNGLTISDGGNHIDYVVDNIVNSIREKLVKKYPNIKPGDIRNKLKLVLIMKNFNKPEYNSQTKEKLTNDRKDIVSYFKDIDFIKITNKILKTPEIIDPITEVYKIKEELKKRQELKGLEKTVKKLKSDDKFMSPIGEWNRIFLAEGDSAKNSVSKILGRDGNGFFAMFGVPPNAYDSDIKKLMSSDKIKDLMRILNLKLSETKQTELNFKEIIITSDFDLPGHFIAGQLIGLFARFGRNLFDEGKIKRFVTPLIIAKDNKGNILKWFFSFDEYREFENTNKEKLIYDYKKGFGAWDREELEFIINKVGLENMLETYKLDDDSIKELDNWLVSKNSDIRKEMLEGYEFNIMGI